MNEDGSVVKVEKIEQKKQKRKSRNSYVKCKLCKKEFDRSLSLVYHIYKFHTTFKWIECNMCDAKYKLQELLNSHIMSIHKNLNPVKNNINDAEIVSSGKPLSRIYCDSCSQWFTSLRIKKIHVDIIHKHMLPYKCDLCDIKSSSIKFALNHDRKHNKINYYLCKPCNYQYLRQDQLVNHIYICHTTLKWLDCDICGLKYKTQILLNNHILDDHANDKNITNINQAIGSSEADEIPLDYYQQNISLSIHSGTTNKTDMVQGMDGFSYYEINKMLPNILQNKHSIINNDMQKKVEMMQEVDINSVCKINQMLSKIKNNNGSGVQNNIFNEVGMAQAVDGSSNCEINENLPEIQQNSVSDIQNGKPNKAETSQVINGSYECNKTININKYHFDEHSLHNLPNKETLNQIHTNIKIKNDPIVSNSPSIKQTDVDIPYFNLLIYEPSSDGLIPYQCDICGRKQRSHLSGLKHANMHCLNKIYPCTHCDEIFYSALQLEEHMNKIHPSFLIKNFQCDRCNNFYATETFLKLHVKFFHKRQLAL